MEILAKLVVSASSLGLAGCETDTESFAKLFGFAGCGRNQSRVSAFAAKPSRDRPLQIFASFLPPYRSFPTILFPPISPDIHRLTIANIFFPPFTQTIVSPQLAGDKDPS